MTWTHCRRCGKELTRAQDRLDGLCFDSLPSCTARFGGSEFGRALLKHVPSDPERIDQFLSSPKRSIAIDAWLEAGAK